jgi:hypothetical protein
VILTSVLWVPLTNFVGYSLVLHTIKILDMKFQNVKLSVGYALLILNFSKADVIRPNKVVSSQIVPFPPFNKVRARTLFDGVNVRRPPTLPLAEPYSC